MSLKEYKLKSLKDKHMQGLEVNAQNVDTVIKKIKKSLKATPKKTK